ncbi:MAG: hypothetical protein CL557_11585 [Alphaproteobacteria bacterium]|nr:hypothetical protein [Alphaproteobacteria bacterium]
MKKDQIKVNNDFKGSQSIVEYPITSSEKSEVINKINKKNNINNAKEVLDGSAPADDKEVLQLQYDYAKEVENVQIKKATKETFGSSLATNQAELDDVYNKNADADIEKLKFKLRRRNLSDEQRESIQTSIDTIEADRKEYNSESLNMF